MTKFFKIILSTKVTLVLLLAFAGAMAVATFIENDYGTETARAMVYEAWWFELIIAWMAVNFLAHINKYKLFSKGKWPVGLFHVAFVIIVLGAGITRYFGKEGMIHIREKQEESTFYTNERYLQLEALDHEKPHHFNKKLTFTPKTFSHFETDVELAGKDLKVKVADYIAAGKESFIEGDQTYVSLAVTMGEGREDFLLKEGQQVKLENIAIATKKDTQAEVKIFKEEGEWLIESDKHLSIMEMSTQKMGTLHKSEKKPLQYMSLYQWDGGAFLVKSINENSALSYKTEEDEKKAENMTDVAHLVVEDTKGNKLTDAFVHVVSIEPDWTKFEYEGQEYGITYGPKAMKLPFSLYLSDFQLERYPGSRSPASYASEVEVRDGENSFPFRIFMNNVLDHAGYRFYQASYDTDEKGTVLSINQDRPGTYITYLGYTLLTLGMLLTLFAKGSRFSLLNKKLSRMHNHNTSKISQKSTLILALLCFSFLGLQAQDKSAIEHSVVPKEKADEYGKLIVQDMDGRMKPLNTLAHEIVRKLSGKTYMPIPLENETVKLSPEQFILAVQLDPITYGNLPLIKIDKEKSLEAFKALGIEPTGRLSFRQFLADDGAYKLNHLVETANKLKPSERNEGHKELLKTDERFNIFYALLSGDFLRLFPLEGEENNTWFTKNQFDQGFGEEDGRFVKDIIPLYLQNLDKGIKEGDWTGADEALGYLSLYQEKIGEEVYPSEMEIKGELLYTELNLGSRLFGPFWLIGIIMLVFAILYLFYDNKFLRIGWKVGTVLSWLGLLVFTFHLGLRWYIAKHPPWSDGFEMLVFVAWGVLFFGLLFSRKSRFTLPLGLLFSGTLLFVGFLDWLNPEITNLMPVLNSYWLKIHVAIIVSGYAPLALAAIIALLSLILLIFKPKNPTNQWWKSMEELTIVNEMSITIGLFLLAVGTFLGGVWANESWGRYWAWDPKETWALISVIVYAIVLHIRLIPNLRDYLIFNLASLWAFSSIIMTSFGVNYYLSGLHSYAKGDPVPIPGWVYWVVGTLLVISVGAIIRNKQMRSQEKLNVTT
ncbi:cytochrome c biogenesis protein [Marivirga tractuosa]|uniref:Cytochrome c assembly protein n=1 Tax=Marivirga tractuosa (strain ATCC 23168 / DSM 4126 / NBRC 15989 / NCIMB 1408 / VKM B-1430 / H-43) TaxID=643867 RepID=E4TR35_MARTH|nr:cytochrome c biogenesis protein CcsA [Marivirga tractuosa]ADR22716.1 cytochrome c assembly protein [Marivirga tractuosa DSM 4126]BDD16613.1 cytochrome c biogenesis protein [Marivirga tractuosa]